ncbi:hypothetical protein SLS62_000156 [Diatrype stigma]|uniref:2EXR domain-containing protein n=1 Tax=Diatrype stigma TaxID=117547 RepID=A0AAN9VCT9_9PEZI
MARTTAIAATTVTVTKGGSSSAARDRNAEAAPAAAAAAAAAATVRARRPPRPRPRSSFTCFTRLPPEIRHMIWQLLLPGPRIFEVRASGRSPPCKNGRLSQFLEPPVLASVCRESRQVAMFSGRWRFVSGHEINRSSGGGGDDDGSSTSSGGGSDSSGDRRGRWTWFDAKTDVLFVHEWWYNSTKVSSSSTAPPLSTYYPTPWQAAHNPYPGHNRFFDLRDFCKDVRTICLHTDSLVWNPLPVPNIFAFNLMNRQLWPRLETYLFCSDVVQLCLPGKAIRALAAAEEEVGGDGNIIFGADRQMAIVGVDDHARLARLQAAICYGQYGGRDEHLEAALRNRVTTAPSSYHMPACGPPPPLMVRLVDPELNRRYAAKQRERLRNVWLHAYYSALPDEAPEVRRPAGLFQTEFLPNPYRPCFNHGHPWAREALAKMPDYRLVVVFQLCMARHVERKIE